jgi:hypothetical protein
MSPTVVEDKDALYVLLEGCPHYISQIHGMDIYATNNLNHMSSTYLDMML